MDSHIIGVGGHGNQVQFPGEIQVHQHSVDCAQAAQATERRDIRREPVRPEFEEMTSFVPQHDNIVEAVILKVAHHHFGVVRTRDGRVGHVVWTESAIGIPK